MTTKFDICTRASLGLDRAEVQSFTDGTRESQLFGAFYEPLKKAELESYPWNFNRIVEKLSLEVGTPTDGRWQYRHLLPADLLSLQDVIDNSGHGVDYEMAKGRIFTNEKEVYAKFQRNITVVDDMPSFFQDLLVARLMNDLAEPLTGEANVIERAKANYLDFLRKARKVDTRENPTRSLIGEQSPWYGAHFGRGGFYSTTTQ